MQGKEEFVVLRMILEYTKIKNTQEVKKKRFLLLKNV